jgi:hypothetical protein
MRPWAPTLTPSRETNSSRNHSQPLGTVSTRTRIELKECNSNRSLQPWPCRCLHMTRDSSHSPLRASSNQTDSSTWREVTLWTLLDKVQAHRISGKQVTKSTVQPCPFQYPKTTTKDVPSCSTPSACRPRAIAKWLP